MIILDKFVSVRGEAAALNAGCVGDLFVYFN